MPLLQRIEAQIAPFLPKGLRRAVKERAEFAFWNGRAAEEGVLSNGHYSHFYTNFFGLTPEDYKGKAIIDIGCGPRGSLEWAHDARERVGLDSLVNEYRGLGIERHKMRYVDAPAESIPFPASHFDFVTSFNALDHVEDLGAALAEIRRVLKPDGTFLLIVEANHEPTVTEPVTIGDKELRALLEAGFNIESWRSWNVPDDHDLYGAMLRSPETEPNGEPAIIAAKMRPRAEAARVA
jgi:SAM-dependent methyltransferase